MLNDSGPFLDLLLCTSWCNSFFFERERAGMPRPLINSLIRTRGAPGVLLHLILDPLNLIQGRSFIIDVFLETLSSCPFFVTAICNKYRSTKIIVMHVSIELFWLYSTSYHVIFFSSVKSTLFLKI